MGGRFVILAAVALLVGGCGKPISPDQKSDTEISGLKTGTNKTARLGIQSRRGQYPGWLEVTADPDKVKAAQRLAEQQQQARFNAILNNPERAFADSEVLQILQARREAAVARLKEHLKMGPWKKSNGAAALLFELDDPKGMAFFRRILGSGTTEQRAAVLNRLSYAYRQQAKLRNDKTLHIVLLMQLNDLDPRVLKAAIQTCGVLRVSGAAKRFAELVKQKGVPDQDRLFFWLSQLDPQPEYVALLAERFRTMHGNNRDRWSLSALMGFARSRNAEAAKAAVESLRDLYQRSLREKDLLRDYDRPQIIGILASRASKQDIAWLRSLLKQKLPSYVLGDVLGKLAELEGEAGRRRIIAALDDPATRTAAISEIGHLYRNSEDQAVVARLKKLADVEKSPYIRRAIAEALLAVGGDDAQQATVRIANGLDASLKMRLLWKARGWSAQSVIERVVATGVISRADYQAALAKLRKDEEADQDTQIDVESVLMAAGIGLEFDAETDTFPNRHDLLVADFGKSSRGQFRPTAVREKWLGKDIDDRNGEYLLEFVHGGRLYRARMRNFGDWYDVERIVTVINIALAEAGTKGRFLSLSTGDQTARFVFGDPKAIQTLSRELYLPQSKDANEAMRLGKEFERKVIEKLKQGQ